VSEPDDPHLLDGIFGTLLRPRATFAQLARLDSARHGAAAIALLGVAWALLCVLLYSSGRAPHAVLLPIPAGSYYLFQAAVTIPVLLALWWLFAELAGRLAGGVDPATRTALGFAYAVPMLAHVAVEGVGYLLFGFDTLAVIAAISLPAASLWVWALSAVALKERRGVGWGRAIAASFAGLLVQAALGSVVLR